MNKKNKQRKSEKKTKILIVDDHSIVRHGLTQLINQELDLFVCAEAESAEQALDIIEQQNVDLAILDISLEGMNGVQLTEKIKSRYPHLPVLILTMHAEPTYAKRAFRAGAKGYVTKQEAAETIITAIRLMLSGRDYISEQMAQKFLKNLNSAGSHC
jgi:DNA-binding NarL/FixJ family response regulator